MIIRRLDELGADRQVDATNWTSRRLLLKGDGMGFSLHDTVIRAGTTTEMHYANHLEAVYCIEGSGTVTLKGSGEVIPIEAGTVYALDQHDEHVLRASTRMRMVCVFNPPLVGPEVHDATGAYPLLESSGAS
ncbi:MAG: ectoine synthase [Deltaproteobacteria bacterium]|nr:ectoine synthase [Deltaproteobacteria bacterium]MCB9786637.1 ectoine synthase [Deltaproteobacteria bacterium]